MARRWGRSRSPPRARGLAGILRLSKSPSRSWPAGARPARAARASREAWRQRLANSAQGAEFERFLQGDVASEVAAPLQAFREQLALEKPKVATRKSSEMTLGVINGATRATIGGSADLTHSNYTITKGMGSIAPGDFSGRYIHYGVREFGMAAAMNGIALHGGFAPYGGTFLVFSDYARAAIRLAALMGVRAVYVLTHDSIGLGEDGPTHQPVEHLASLRAMPNLNVFRPADAIETAECWELALAARKTPSVLSLSRQNLPTLERPVAENLSARGAYVLQEPEGGRDVTLLATGSEVADRAGGGEAARSARQARGGRLHAELRAVRGAAGRLSRLRAGNGAARRRRGRRTLWLGPLAWRDKRLRRHDRLWRERARRGAVRAFWHYASDRGASGAGRDIVGVAKADT